MIGRKKQTEKSTVKNPAVSVLVDLGRCDGFIIDPKTHLDGIRNKDIKLAAKKNYRLLSTADGKTLYALRGPRRTVKDPGKSSVEKQAEKLYSRWSDFEPDNEYMLSIGDTTWKNEGDAKTIFYTSDKWSAQRRLTGYVHDFDHKTTLYSAKTAYGIQYKLKGAFQVKKEGITG